MRVATLVGVCMLVCVGASGKPTPRQRIESLEAAIQKLHSEFPQFSDITDRIYGYQLSRIMHPDRPHAALFIDLVGNQGGGKTRYAKAVARVFGVLALEHVCKVEGEVFLPVEKILELAQRNPDEMHGLKGVLLIDEMHRARGLTHPPNYDEIYNSTYQKSYREKYAELVAQWEEDSRKADADRVFRTIESAVRSATPPRPAPQTAGPGQQGGQGGKKGGEKRKGGNPASPTTEEPAPIVVEEPPPPPTSVIVKMPDIARPEAPRALAIQADQFARATAASSVALEKKNWELNLRRRQILRDATSGTGDILVEGSELATTILQLREAADAYALAVLEAQEDVQPEIEEVQRELEAAEKAFEALRPHDAYEELRNLREQISRLEKTHDKLEKARSRTAPVAASPAVPSGNLPLAATTPDPDQLLSEILKLHERREALPSDADFERYEELRAAVNRKKDDVRTKKAGLADRIAQADEQLVQALERHKIAKRLLEADSDIIKQIASAGEAEGLETLLLDHTFLARRLAQKPEQLVRELLRYVKDRAPASVRRAEGVIAFGIGNFPKWDEEVENKATNKDDIDSIAQSDEQLRRNPDGRRLMLDYTRDRLGRVPGEDGKDQDEESMLSRVGGPWAPRRKLTRQDWEKIIRQNLEEIAEKATQMGIEEYGVEGLQVEVDASINQILFKAGANRKSDLRLYEPVLHSFTGAFWKPFANILKTHPKGPYQLLVRYNVNTLQIEYVLIRPGAEIVAIAPAPPPVSEATESAAPVAPLAPLSPPGDPVIGTVSFAPKRVFNHADEFGQQTSTDLELYAHREAARMLMGTLIFGSFARVPVGRPERAPGQPYWDVPTGGRYWRVELAGILLDLAAVAADARFRSGQRSDQARELRDNIKVRLEALLREFEKDVPPDSRMSVPLQLFHTLTPAWFHGAEPVQSMLKTLQNKDVLTVAESIVQTVLDYRQYEPLQRDLVQLLFKIFSGESVDAAQDQLQALFLHDKREFPSELGVRIDALPVASVRLPPERCDFTLVQNIPDLDLTPEPKSSGGRRWWRLWLW